MDLKLKVSKIEQTTRGGYSITFDGGTQALFTDKNLPPEVKEGAEVECQLEDVKKKTGDGTWTAVKFPKYQQQRQQGSKTWQGGSREDVELKIVSFAMSYAKDLFVNTPDSTLEGMFTTCDKIAEHMLSLYKKLKA